MLEDIAMAHHGDKHERGSGTPQVAGGAPPAGQKSVPPGRTPGPPRPRPEWVDRPDLIRRLNQATATLVLVAAPAGYGKTTLLAQWSTRPADGRSFAWLTLDRGDNKPAVLWSDIVRALHQARSAPGGGRVTQAVRGRYTARTETLQGLLAEFASFPGRTTLVLDNYDLITEAACHEQLELLVLCLPSQSQIVLGTRVDPPLPLARLRATGQLTEIRAQDLRLTRDEAAAVIRAVTGSMFGEPALRDLVERTEGWPAGVYLAALALRGQPDPDAFAREFTGRHPYIEDFLKEEVISRQPGHIRRFLEHTAVLRRLTAPLCDAVTGRTEAHEILEEIESQNLFLVPLDDNREWFRYNQLFADTLRNEIAKSEPELVPILHTRASAWYRQQGLPAEAIYHALAAGDIDAATAVIAEHWLSYMDAGRAVIVLGWLEAVGDDAINARPLAAHCAAWVAALTGQRESALRRLAVIESGPPIGPLPDGMRSTESSAALLRGTFGFGGPGPMRTAAARAVELERDSSSPWYALARTALGCSLYLAGDLPAAARWLQDAVMCAASLAMVRNVAFSYLTLVALEQGRQGQASELARSALDNLANEGHGLSEAPQGSLAHMAAGAVYASQGRMEDARREFEDGLRMRRRWLGLSPWPIFEILLRLAPVLDVLGDEAGASAALAEARAVLSAYPQGDDAQLDRLTRLETRLQARRAGPIAESLTAREEAVLRLLHGALSRREIGRELCVSANTVKSHTRAIYRKLGVTNRHDAVRRGRELGIL